MVERVKCQKKEKNKKKRPNTRAANLEWSGLVRTCVEVGGKIGFQPRHSRSLFVLAILSAWSEYDIIHLYMIQTKNSQRQRVTFPLFSRSRADFYKPLHQLFFHIFSCEGLHKEKRLSPKKNIFSALMMLS